MKPLSRSRQFASISLLAGAVLFGLVAVGGSELSTPGVAAPLAQAGDVVPASTITPVKLPAGLPSFADLAERVLPSVVSIEAQTIERGRTRRDGPQGQDPFEFFFGPRGRPDAPEDRDREFRSDSGGSGFVVSPDGFVITNNHVIEGATKVRVRLDERIYDAEVKGTDEATDLALLKIDAGRALAYLPLGDSDRLRVGDYVMAIGNPLLLDHTVTVGVVSAKGRSIGLTRDSSFENFIQTDAAINRGNSGGPLVNLAGEVVGIATAMNWGAENIGFAVPVSTLKAVLPQLREKGKVSRGYIGVNISNVDYDRAQAFGLSEAGGALVTQVVEGSPASKAGVEHGDIVLSVDGRKVKETRDLIEYVSAQGPGKAVELEILRDGKRMNKRVQLAEREGLASEESRDDQPDASPVGWLGLQYQDLTPGLRQSLGLPNTVEGVVVSEVAAASPLYDEGVGEGDIIVEVNGEPVADSASFERRIQALPSGSFARLYVKRMDGRGASDREVNFFAVVRVP